MRISEFETRLDEAMPMGGLQRLGQTIRSKLPGLGASMAAGKLQTGNVANAMIKDYYQHLGQQGQQPTSNNLIQFLKLRGYPTKKAIISLRALVEAAPPIPLTKEKMNAAILAAAAEYIAIQSAAPIDDPSAAPPPGSGTPPPGSGTPPPGSGTPPPGSGTPPPPSGGTLPAIDFSNQRQVQALVRQLNTFKRTGAKLNPALKTRLQTIISGL